MRILVDMDDTIELLLEAWVEAANEKFGTNVTCEDITNWDVSRAFPGVGHDEVYNIISDEEFWKRVKPVPGAPEALKRFIDSGHEVYVVTVTPHEQVKSKMENVLFKYFPYIDFNHVIITSRKQLLKADVLIDDGFHNLVGGDYHKILVDAPYNREFDEKSEGMLRVFNWDEIEKAVNDIYKKFYA